MPDPGRRHLVVMVKEPRLGRVKTRLARDIGAVNAAWWFRHQSLALLRRLDGPRWRLWLSVSPDRDGMRSRIWPAHLPRLPQGRGDLGMRMAQTFDLLPKGPAIIVGADIPAITPTHIERAFKALAAQDAVFGPAMDGGYWLVGLRGARPPSLFQGVRWSTEHALADTMTSLGDKRIALVDMLRDVDTAADLSA